MNKIYGINIDTLRLCYEVEKTYHVECLKQMKIGDRYEGFYDFYLIRIEGKYYDYVYEIKYDELGDTLLFGELRLGIRHDNISGNQHQNGLDKAWISISNRVLYSHEFYYLENITSLLGLELHNITCLDICVDLSKDIGKALRKLIRNKNITTILNRKIICHRKEDRPEISFCFSGDMDKDKYLTTTIKQKKAIRDKTKGCTLTAYNKRAEILNSSGKQYILDYYGNPRNLYRVEIHLNNEEIKNYVHHHIKDEFFNYYSIIFDKSLLWKLLGYHLQSIIYFQDTEKTIDWGDILAGVITTSPAKDDFRALTVCKTDNKKEKSKLNK